MNQHQTHRLCARIHATIELPLAAALLKQQQQQSAAAVKEAGLSSYVNNEKENIEDEMKDRVLLAQLVEATKGTSTFFFILFGSFLEPSSFLPGALPMMIHPLSTTDNIKKQLEPEF